MVNTGIHFTKDAFFLKKDYYQGQLLMPGEIERHICLNETLLYRLGGKQGVGLPTSHLGLETESPRSPHCSYCTCYFLISHSLLASSCSTLLMSTFLPLKSLGIAKQLQPRSGGTPPARSHGICASAQMLLCQWRHSCSH